VLRITEEGGIVGFCVLPDLLDTCDICLIQEHWLFTKHLSDLNSVNNEFASVGVSGMDSGILLCGHPYMVAVGFFNINLYLLT